MNTFLGTTGTLILQIFRAWQTLQEERCIAICWILCSLSIREYFYSWYTKLCSVGSQITSSPQLMRLSQLSSLSRALEKWIYTDTGVRVSSYLKRLSCIGTYVNWFGIDQEMSLLFLRNLKCVSRISSRSFLSSPFASW